MQQASRGFGPPWGWPTAQREEVSATTEGCPSACYQTSTSQPPCATLSTLRYASRARKIVNVVRVNEDPTTTLIRELQDQLARMRESVLNGDVDGLQGMLGTDGPITAGIMAQKTQELEAVINQIQVRAPETLSSSR